MKQIILIISGLLISLVGWNQERLNGTVHGTENNKEIILPGANIYWLDSQTGTVSGPRGSFSLKRDINSDQLVVSFIGYKNDTLHVPASQKTIRIVLESSENLDEITISDRQKGEYTSKIKPLQTQTITEKGLQKLPCCNLSESFENTATVDVGFTDAVTGAKQIKMLGLAGKYSQIMIEKRPNFRGLSTGFGLMYIPGSWMESIQISKGTSSVVDGFESMTGQINVEYKKPEKSNPLHVNLYSNIKGRLEANILAQSRLSDKWSTMLLISGNHLGTKHDNNADGFLDAPLTDQVHIFNRWKLQNGNHQLQAGFSILDEKRKGGQTMFSHEEPLNSKEYYGIGINTRKYEGFLKTGIAFETNHHHSVALIGSAVYHEMNSFFGLKNYNATQKSVYTNLIYQTELWNENHTMTAGLSFLFDNYDIIFNSLDLGRTEAIPGSYAEYNYNKSNRINVILGLRYDHSSLYNGFWTPRLHTKYNLTEKTILRASVGRGHRVANIIVENTGLLASSREIIILEELAPEDGWNAGVNLTHDFHIGKTKKLAFSIDFYRTQFVNQVMVDMDKDKSKVYFYNLDGTSFSNSLQAEVSTELIERFDVTLAFRMNDVQVTLNNELQQKPYVNKYKGLLSASYASQFEKWKFDVTVQYNGQSRLPDISENMNMSASELYSPTYFILHSQISRKFKHFSIYAGGENLSNFVQDDPIINPENPFSDSFDASRIWGPILGRVLFLGIRFDIE